MNMRGQERREFSQAVRKAAFKRCCGKDGIPRCENCGTILRAGDIIFEHVQPAGLGGEPTLENCKVFCLKVCATRKTVDDDNPRMQKADRVLKKSFGLQAKRKKIQSPGFPKFEPQRTASRPLSRRPVERQP
jgi:hypothetical protein